MVLTVQQEPISARPVTPLPTNEYWTRPINGMNPEWTSIAGDWLNVDPGQTVCYTHGAQVQKVPT